ncbi:MAG TPA: sugar phosphate isomerase/epimerase [Bacillales bacterium]|nr:sugar phosphate isomerase/epimerase [Bacillales bacterium]
MANIGLQLFSVWQYAEKDFLGTLERVADLGYKSVQFAGFFGVPASEVKDLMDRKGVKAAGAHVPIEQLSEDKLEETFDYHKEIGNDLLIVPALPKEMRENADDYLKTARRLNQIGEACKEAGFAFGYHNHDFEFKKMDGVTGFDLLFENTDPDLVKMELDCYWATYAGYDPLKILSDHSDRAVSLHLKDIKTVGDKKVSTEIGNGELNISSLVETGLEHGVKWFTVEQESFEMDPFESLKISADNLGKLLSEALK